MANVYFFTDKRSNRQTDKTTDQKLHIYPKEKETQGKIIWNNF